MDLLSKEWKQELFDLIDQVKELLSPEIWENRLLNCTKNELFLLWLLYRRGEVTMSQAAEYLQVPLNTVTGIANRMEKREFLLRERSEADKRVVTLRLAGQGRVQMEELVDKLMSYAEELLSSFQPEELALLARLAERIVGILQEERQQKRREGKKVRRITIE